MLKLMFGDCLNIIGDLPDDQIDLIITDPPYPDYHVDLYGTVDLDFLDQFTCPQFIFWSAKVDFPLSYSAIHIWDKKTGAGSEYERIFERNGKNNWKVFRHYLINSEVAARYTGDVFTGHPSQKPLKLILDLIKYSRLPQGTILDPFAGSGTTGIAALETGNDWIGIEKDPSYYDMAMARIRTRQSQPFLPDIVPGQVRLI